MATLCGDLDTALGQSQGVQAALANIADWLDKMDEAFKNINKPASLIRDRLDEQIRQLKALQADVDSHESGIQKMYQAAQEFVQSSKNVRESKKIESKVKEVQVKYQGLVKAVQTRGVFLDEISIGLGHFTGQVESFDDWYMEMIEVCYYFLFEHAINKIEFERAFSSSFFRKSKQLIILMIILIMPTLPLLVFNKEILESFLFCMYLGSFILPL